MDALWAVLGTLAVLHVAYATWTAKRLDRLHARVDAARAALDQQLRRRAEVALSFAESARPPQARELIATAREASVVGGLGHDREVAENALSRALQEAAPQADDALFDVTTRTSFARRFHNDAVRDVQEVRSRRVVRWFHLAGHAPMPTFFEMDDAALERRTIGV